MWKCVRGTPSLALIANLGLISDPVDNGAPCRPGHSTVIAEQEMNLTIGVVDDDIALYDRRACDGDRLRFGSSALAAANDEIPDHSGSIHERDITIVSDQASGDFGVVEVDAAVYGPECSLNRAARSDRYTTVDGFQIALDGDVVSDANAAVDGFEVTIDNDVVVEFDGAVDGFQTSDLGVGTDRNPAVDGPTVSLDRAVFSDKHSTVDRGLASFLSLTIVNRD